MAKAKVLEKSEAAVRDALDHARTATQELHQTISRTLAKRASTSKAEVEGAIRKAKEAAESTRSAVGARQGTAQDEVKKQLMAAVGKLDAAEKHAAESFKSSGDAFHTALGKALADARSSVQDISEAVAAHRSEQAAKHAPVKQAS